MREWNRLVQQTYKEGKSKSPIYSLKDAMLDARKVYKKGVSVAEDVAEGVVKGVTKGITAKKRRGKSGTKKRRGKKNRSGNTR